MRNLLFGIILLSPIMTQAGGGWTQDKGSGFYKLGQNIIIGTQYFTPDGSIEPITTISLYTTSIYAEYGITNRITGIVYFPFFVRSTLNEERIATGQVVSRGDSFNGLGDTDVSIKYGITKGKRIALSASLTLGLPLGATDGGETRILQSGDGEFNQMISIDAGTGFGYGIYANANLGYNNRTKNFSNELRYGFETGWSNEKLTGLIRFIGIKPLGDEGAPANTNNGVFGNRIEYLSFTPEALYLFSDKIGASLSVGMAFYGKRILANPNYGFGLFMKL